MMNVPGLKILLMGPPGTGKTRSVQTLVDAGLEPFCILTEPNSLNTILDTRTSSDKYKEALAAGKVHWQLVQPAQASWGAMAANAKMITQFDHGTLQKQPGMNKSDYAQIMDLYSACANFTDQNGEEFGPIDEFDENKVLFLDSMSGLNIIFMDHVTGGKPIKSQPDWGVAMDDEERFLHKLCFGVNCHLVVTAHVDRETDFISGGMKLMVKALGSKLPPKIPATFTDCILTVREGDEFHWSTATTNADTKSTTMPWGSKLDPSFVPLITEWKERLTNLGA